jgi:hypothetical protein
MSEQDQDGRPVVPTALVEAIKAYGDARAAGDLAQSAKRLEACIHHVRDIMGGILAVLGPP